MIDDRRRQRRSPEREALSWDVVPEREAVRVCPAGALDMATAPGLRSQLQELRTAGFQLVILDLRQLDFMDSTGLRLILELDAEARQAGFSIVVVPGPPTVQRVFDVTGTAALIPFVTG